jgi:hypothetical protein
MQETDLRIEASHEALAQLKEALYRNVNDVDIQEDAELRTGQHGESLLIGLIIALGGVTLTREVMGTIRHWLDQRTKAKKLETVKFYIQNANGSRDVTLEEIMKLAT